MTNSCLYYKPVVINTKPEISQALKESYLSGDGICPACKEEGREVKIQERLGETVCERDGTYIVCLDSDLQMRHGASLD